MASVLVSVILPVFNGENFLAQTISSILDQKDIALELIVVDDGSTDRSQQIVAEFADQRIRYIYMDNAGVSAARNRGVQAAKGSYLAFMDADDLWEPNKLARQIEYMERHPKTGYTIVKGLSFLSQSMASLPLWVREEEVKTPYTAAIPSALVVRSYVFDYVGPFDEKLLVGEDSDWFWRARDYGIESYVIDEVLLKKRIHTENLTGRSQEIHVNLLQLAQRSMARKSRKSISVVIPNYNGERYLEEALYSVFHQTYKPCEIIVADDGSTDRSLEILDNYASIIQVLRLEHKGVAAARNAGVSSASGEYIAFLDADDLWAKHKLEVQIQAWTSEQDICLLYGEVQQFISPDVKKQVEEKYLCDPHPKRAPIVGSLLLKRSHFFQIGPFDEHLHTGEFIEWHARALHIGASARILPEVLLFRRIHLSNHGIIEKVHNQDFAKAVKSILELRKKRDLT